MQRLEVSGALRPPLGSLGVKGLERNTMQTMRGCFVVGTFYVKIWSVRPSKTSTTSRK